MKFDVQCGFSHPGLEATKKEQGGSGFMEHALRVLLVEDRVDDAELMCRELCRERFILETLRVETETDYLAALCPELDVIIADHNLPGCDSSRALMLAKQRALDVPVIVVSGTTGEELAVRIMREGAADYLLKDNLGQLGMAVRRALECRRLDITERHRIECEVLEISERERVRIGQDLHDGLGQGMTSLGCLIESLGRKLRGRAAAEADDLPRIQEMVKDIVIQIRGLSRSLRPVTIARSGLTAALVELTTSAGHTAGVTCEFEPDGPVRVDADTATHLYRIVQEALANAIRHANARNIKVMLKNTDRGVMLTVRDDGIGIPAETERAVGLGLKTMAYRARIIDGVLRVARGPEGGTIVECVIAADRRQGLMKPLGTWRPVAHRQETNPQKTGQMAKV